VSGETKPIFDCNSAAANPLPRVQDDRYYKVTMQFGASRTWRREYRGQKRTPVATSQPGEVELRHNPRLFIDQGPFSGKIVNGLIQEHAEWLEKFRHKQPDGELDHQLLVLGVNPTTDMPVNTKNKLGDDVVALISALVSQAVQTQSPKLAKA
jgi:hypothetical protein